LFFYGPQGSGKSIVHEALSLLVTCGVARAENALTNTHGFNQELENAILCIVEEMDLKKNKTAYNRIKDWVTARDLPIHPKGKTPYTIPNTGHWMQFSNSLDSCPVFPGDTRIVLCYVPELSLLDVIPKKRLISMLQSEAPDFIAEIFQIEIPEPNDRLNVPVIVTSDKAAVEESNLSMVELFIKERCFHIPGKFEVYGDLYDHFIEWLDPNEVFKWTKQKFGSQLPHKHPKGRSTLNAQLIVGNISLTPAKEGEPAKPNLTLQKEFLRPEGA
jgi:phage/plasmid-associated DNA primase